MQHSLSINDTGRTDAARQKFGAVAGAGLHIQHLHPGLDAGEGQHFGGLAALVDLPVGIGPVGGGDDRLIVRCLRQRARRRRDRQ